MLITPTYTIVSGTCINYIIIYMYIDTCSSYKTSLAAVAGVLAVSVVYSIVITLAVTVLLIERRKKKIR